MGIIQMDKNQKESLQLTLTLTREGLKTINSMVMGFYNLKTVINMKVILKMDYIMVMVNMKLHLKAIIQVNLKMDYLMGKEYFDGKMIIIMKDNIVKVQEMVMVNL